MEEFLHLPTLMVVYALGTFMVGIISAAIWLRDRANRSFKILLMAALAGIASAVLQGARELIPFWVSTSVGFPLAFLATGLSWSAFRVFEGKPPAYLLASSGAILSIALSPLPLFHESSGFRVSFAGLIIGTCYLLCAWEVYSHCKSEPLQSRFLVVTINLVQSVIWYVRIPLAAFDGAIADNDHVKTWFLVVTLFSALNNVFIMFSLTLLAKDRSENEYKKASRTDSLTGLKNRGAFVEQAGRFLSARRTGVALLMVDIDKFKSINDVYGHEGGDHALIAFANVLKASGQKDWIVARLGGEEFACLLRNAGPQAAVDAAEKIRKATEALEVSLRSRKIKFTVSIGVAFASDDKETLDSLLSKADGNLYRAKNTGRNRICVTEIATQKSRPSFSQGGAANIILS